MAGAWCLPKDLSQKFLAALKSGELAPDTLMDMTSAERRATFAKYVGDENAQEVNAQFEAKLLLKDKQAGLISWAKKIGGITEATRRDIVSTIGRMDRILSPEEEEDFLADLAAKKLGTSVTADEAKQIFQLSQRAEQLRAQITEAGEGDYRQGWTKEGGTEYGKAVGQLQDYLQSLKPPYQSFWTKTANILNLPKSVETGILHFSAPFVQCWGMIGTKQWFQGFGQMFQYFGNEANFKDLEGYILGHPDYEFAKQGKLSITKLSDQLSTREEGIQSSLLEQANTWLSNKTGLPNVVRASSRGFTGYLNFVRFNRFVELLNAARLTGEDVTPTSQVTTDLAQVVNNFTGRGELGPGDRYANAGPLINGIFFAPRKIVATVQMFNPVFYARLSPVARTAALKQLTGSLIATGAVLSIAKAMGAQVSADPRDQNFAKIVINGEKLDMTGGNAIYLRMLARLVTGQEVTAKGKEIALNGQGPFGESRADVVLNYMRGKLAPVAGAFADFLYGKDAVGRPFSMTREMQERLMPITVSSYTNFLMNDPNNTVAILPSLAAIFGVGLESPRPPMSTSGYDPWGQPLSQYAMYSPRSWTDDPVNKEAEKIGYTPKAPTDKIRGVELTDGQYQDYVRTAGRMAHMQATSLISQPMYQGASVSARYNMMKATIRRAHEAAANAIMAESQGTQNDILKQAFAAKYSQQPQATEALQ